MLISGILLVAIYATRYDKDCQECDDMGDKLMKHLFGEDDEN